MKTFILISIASLVLTVTGWTLPYFIVGIELFFLPFLIIFFLIGAIGVIVIPIGVFLIVQKKPVNKWIIWISGIAIGFYIGYIILTPIDRWDENERNISGQIISQELEIYKQIHGNYPEKLNLLDTLKLENNLPLNYKVSRFNYSLEANEYHLDIPIPITERWHWRKQERKWSYRE